MKILYLGIASKYIHTMPAGWFLSEFLTKNGFKVTEIYRNVNEDYKSILNDITELDIDILLLSVYIFNVKLIKRLIKDIKKLKPGITFIIGGPEADEDLGADFIILGEGERALLKLLKSGGDKVTYEDIIDNLDEIPSPYTRERLSDSRNKLIYYESSRGCPYRCAYCMAGLSQKVRYFSLERVYSDLKNIVSSGAKIVKFTDRTFNANRERTENILEFIKDNFSGSGACFHLEIGGDIIKESTLELLKTMPPGLIQLETGVQSLNEKSLKAVDRAFSWEKFYNNISRIISSGNIHTHIDLIIGLPYDNLDTFGRSMDKVFALRPHMLQLNLLKMLKYTPIRKSYKAVFNNDAPYEIIKTPDMSEEDIMKLIRIQSVFNRVYNSGRFYHTLEFMLKKSAYEFFVKLSDYLYNNGIDIIKPESLSKGILEYSGNDERVRELMRFDYLLVNNSRIKPALLRKEYTEEFKKFISGKNDCSVLYEEFSCLYGISEKRVIIKFDYKRKNPVSGRYGYEIVN